MSLLNGTWVIKIKTGNALSNKIYNIRIILHKIINSKLKITIISSTIFIIIGCVNTLFHTTNNDKDYTYLENRRYFRHLEKICKEMTIEEKLIFIQDGDKILEQIKARVNSDSLNPEERFDARSSLRFIKHELEIVKKSLPEEIR